MQLNSSQQNNLIAKIIYGDIHKAPLSILGDLNPYQGQPNKNYAGMDTEQITRLSIAATLQEIFERENI